MQHRGGNDTLRVQVAGDELWGGPARDYVYGGPGDDFVLGDETLLGNVSTSQAGDDVIFGGPGREEVHGEGGDDVIFGGDGNDNVSPVSIGGLDGGLGEDVIRGGDGNDFVVGAHDGGQRDRLYCGKGRDEYLADNIDYVSSTCEVRIR